MHSQKKHEEETGDPHCPGQGDKGNDPRRPAHYALLTAIFLAVTGYINSPAAAQCTPAQAAITVGFIILLGALVGKLISHL